MEAQILHENLPPTSKREHSLILNKYNDEALSPPIKVYLPHNLSSQQFLELFPSKAENRLKPAYGFSAINDWFSRLVQNLKLQQNEAHPHYKRPYELRELDIETADWFSKNKLGFMKIQSTIKRGDGPDDWVSGAVFLRGGSVAILVSHLTFISRPWSLIHV
jgi:ADP-sugar diphosphatase